MLGTESMKITLQGRVPSKKNQKQIVYVKGRSLLLPSKAHQVWHKDAAYQLKESYEDVRRQFYNEAPSSHMVTVWYAPDARVYDLSNKFESVADLLVDCDFLEDDNYKIISENTNYFGGIDRINPRVEIYLVPKMNLPKLLNGLYI